MKRSITLCAIFLLFITNNFAQAGCGNIIYFNSSSPPNSGGNSGGGETYTPPEDDNPTDNNSGSDLSISNLYISIKGQDDWKSKITKTLKPGQSFKIEGKAKVKNESDVEAEDVRVKFRVDHGKTLIPMTQSLIKKVKKT